MMIESKTTSSPCFRLIEESRQPARLLYADDHVVIDQYEWLQLTIGRFLAPATVTEKGVSYGVLGRDADIADIEDRKHVSKVLQNELVIFQRVVLELQNGLGKLVSSGRGKLEWLLISLQVLEQLRLPAPSAEHCHLCGDALQLTGWGLEQGPRLLDLDEAYFNELRKVLSQKYRFSANDLAMTDAARSTPSPTAEDFLQPLSGTASDRWRPEVSQRESRSPSWGPATSGSTTAHEYVDLTKKHQSSDRQSKLPTGGFAWRLIKDAAVPVAVGLLLAGAFWGGWLARPGQATPAAAGITAVSDPVWAIQFTEGGKGYLPVIMQEVREGPFKDGADAVSYYIAVTHGADGGANLVGLPQLLQAKPPPKPAVLKGALDALSLNRTDGT